MSRPDSYWFKASHSTHPEVHRYVSLQHPFTSLEHLVETAKDYVKRGWTVHEWGKWVAQPIETPEGFSS